MFVRGDCHLPHNMYARLNNFMYIFNLRQGAILIAVHQIALSSFILIILMVCISHAAEMLSMLHNDMEDDAERHGFYEVFYGDIMTFREGDMISTNNQRRFAKAQHLASATVVFLYVSTMMTSIYLVCCMSLLHGAVRYKREYMTPWICTACIAAVLLIAAFIAGDSYPALVNFFNGHTVYHCVAGIVISTYVYAICTVTSFAIETGRGNCRVVRSTSDYQLGERLLLLDHTAHSSLLSAAQINKLSQGTRTQFV